MGARNMSVIAAGIAFYEVWALFPALVALVIVGEMVFGDAAVAHMLSWIRIDLPESFDVVVIGQLKAIAQQSRGISGLSVAGAVLFSFWSAMRGVKGLIQALNLVHGEDEKRSFWRRQLVALGLACFSGALLLLAICLVVALPPYHTPRGDEITFVILAPSRWPVLTLLLMISLSVIFRYGPSGLAAKWRWVTWGAAGSAIIIVVGSFLLSYYTSHFAHFNPLLGSLGAVTIFLLWSHLNVLAILFGAQVNAELERKLS
jgi:membrane protein